MISTPWIEITLEPITIELEENLFFFYLSHLIIWSTQWKVMADVTWLLLSERKGHSSLE